MGLWSALRHSTLLVGQCCCLPGLYRAWQPKDDSIFAMPGVCKRQKMAMSASTASDVIRLAIVGDVHNLYGPEDEAALSCLRADAVLYVGDFGEENIEVVKGIAAGQTPRAVILGNHDAWYSLSGPQPNYEGAQAQLAALQDLHIGYSSRTFSTQQGHEFVVAGGRPFSRGGDNWSRIEAFYAHMCHIDSLEHSAKRTAKVLRSAASAKQGPVILMAHNGPLGLGSQPHDICGVDWRTAGGDHGDPDLQAALQQVQGAVHVPLVALGHMHHRLNSRHGGALRRMAHIDAQTGTVYLNAAVVPRVEQVVDGTRRHFLVVKLAQGEVIQAHHTWVHAIPVHVPAGGGDSASSQLEQRAASADTDAADQTDTCLRWQCTIASEEALLRTDSQSSEVLVRTVFNAHAQSWDAPVCTNVPLAAPTTGV